mmetsp:Transcript_19991/g.18983  ORF Transcript_19991/g.18983 Transcript_19991/m.18983 type:complete len:167 (+) Transcript_19991:285-785(+)
MGGYDETPDQFAAAVKEFALEGLINMVGGCCGTTPAYINEVRKAMEGLERRALNPDHKRETMFSGLQEFIFRDNIAFVNIGERCNLSGSLQFKKMIAEGRYEDAVKVAKDQVENGAIILDFNVDEGLIDGVAAMTKFVRLATSNTDVANVPLMIDSSKFEVIEAGL